MDAMIDWCAYLDVHQANVVAALNEGAADKDARKAVRTFPPRAALGQMRD